MYVHPNEDSRDHHLPIHVISPTTATPNNNPNISAQKFTASPLTLSAQNGSQAYIGSITIKFSSRFPQDIRHEKDTDRLFPSSFVVARYSSR